MARQFKATGRLNAAATEAYIYTARQLASAAGIAEGSAQKAFRGEPVSAKVVAKIVAGIERTGEDVDVTGMFDLVEGTP